MSKLLNVQYENKPCYDIVIEHDFSKLADKLLELGVENKKVCIISETNVAPIYLDEVEKKIGQVAKKVCHYVFDAGEANKNIDTICGMYECLIKEQFDRKDILVALGGGVVGDMTGFAAATYLRGISFVQVPTSLLSQVDSSIGGKTGIDFKCYKNMVGAFKQPSLVYVNINTLKSLPEREYLSGMGEIIKHGYIKNKAFLNWLSDNRDEIISLNEDILEQMVFESLKVKKNVVEKDPLEKGERAHLNFGHTLGHAIEKEMNFSLLHGECVALGMVCALSISAQKGYISKEEYEEGVRLIQAFKLPVKINKIAGFTNENVVNATLLDKKMESGVIKFVLLSEVGNAVIDKTVTLDEMREALGRI